MGLRQRKADANRLEYLRDKVARLEKEISEWKAGLAEFQQANENMLKVLALRYGGGEEREILIDRKKDVSGYAADVSVGEDVIRIKVYEEEKNG